MRHLVIDASVALKWYVPEINASDASQLLHLRERGSVAFHVPDLFLIETVNILWKKWRLKELNEQEVDQITDAVLSSPKTVHTSRALLVSAKDIARAFSISVYDSLYLALAVALNCPLVTADRKLYRSLFGTRLEPFAWWITTDIGAKTRATPREG